MTTVASDSNYESPPAFITRPMHDYPRILNIMDRVAKLATMAFKILVCTALAITHINLFSLGFAATVILNERMSSAVDNCSQFWQRQHPITKACIFVMPFFAHILVPLAIIGSGAFTAHYLGQEVPLATATA
jgi:hypothetical protein